MGCTSSRVVSADQQHVIRRDVDELRGGDYPRDSFRYKLLLMNLHTLFEQQHFWTLPIDILTNYVSDLGLLQVKEAKQIAENIVKFSASTESDARDNLTRVLSVMRLEAKAGKETVFVSPSVDAALFKKVVSSSYKVPWGKKFQPGIKVDWDSEEVRKAREEQAGEDKSKFLRVNHSEDAAEVVMENPVGLLWRNEARTACQAFEKAPSRPRFGWKPSIHVAAVKGDKASLLYDLYVLPELIDAQTQDTLDTPVHFAVTNARIGIIRVLHEMGADFNVFNGQGLLPIHIATKKDVVQELNKLGCDINKRNRNGDSLLDIKTRDFDKKIIETALKLGANIFEANPKGTFWMQEAINRELYGDMGFQKFQKFVRDIIKKNATASYSDNAVFKEVMARPVKKCEELDAKDLSDSVTNRNLERVNVLLALGARADRPRSDGVTNIMYCAENGLTDLARTLGSNFCNPNVKNSAGENTFRVAVLKKFFETARALRDVGADVDALANDGLTVLHLSYKNQIKDVFQFCLDVGCSPNTKNANGMSVLFIAFSKKDDKTAEMMQDKHGGDISSQNKDGDTLAHIALDDEDIDRLKYYLDRKINTEVRNNDGHTIFMSAFLDKDMDVCELLLDRGSNINATDHDGNTCLMLTCLRNKKFSRKMFDFLIAHHCNVSIENKERQFALSLLIENDRTEEANIVFNEQTCQVVDPQSRHEPIVVALRANSQYWVDALVSRGANAANRMEPVVCMYISSPFYNLDTLKRMAPMNLVIGTPLQLAMRKNDPALVDYLWDSCDVATRCQVSGSQDGDGQTPLMVAMNMGYKKLADNLINTQFEMTRRDKSGMNALMHACKLNNSDWMNRILSLVQVDGANVKDNTGNSAFTYSAGNRNLDFCDTLFCMGADIRGCNRDTTGVVDAYCQILDTYDRILADTSANVEAAKSSSSACDQKLAKVESKIAGKKSEISDAKSKMKKAKDEHQDVSGYQERITKLESKQKDLEKKRKEKQTKAKKAKQMIKKYQQRHDEVKNATLKDIRTKLKYFADLAQPEDDIGQDSGSQSGWGKYVSMAPGLSIFRF